MTENEIKNLKDDIKDIKDNHLSHLRLDMAELKTDMSWLKKYHWIIAGAAIGGLATGIINILFK